MRQVKFYSSQKSYELVDHKSEVGDIKIIQSFSLLFLPLLGPAHRPA